MKAPTLDVDQAGLPMLPYARSRLLQLEQRRASTGAPFLHDRVFADGATTIDITASAVSPKIRIRAGRAAHIAAFVKSGVHYAVVTDSRAEVLKRIRIADGFTILAVAISADGGTQYVVTTDTLYIPSTGGSRIIRLYKLTSAGVEIFSTTHSVPVGWVSNMASVGFEGCFPRNARDFKFAENSGKCLLFLGLTEEVGHRRLHPTTDYHYNFVAVVLYFSGAALELQESQWASTAPLNPTDTIHDSRQWGVSIADDCSKWVLIVDGIRTQQSYALYTEVHETATGAVTVDTSGTGYDLAAVLAGTIRLYFSVVEGYISSYGPVTRYSVYDERPAGGGGIETRIKRGGTVLYTNTYTPPFAPGDSFVVPYSLVVAPTGEVVFVDFVGDSFDPTSGMPGNYYLYVDSVAIDSIPAHQYTLISSGTPTLTVRHVGHSAEAFLLESSIGVNSMSMSTRPLPFSGPSFMFPFSVPYAKRVRQSGAVVMWRFASDPYKLAVFSPVRDGAGVIIGYDLGDEIVTVPQNDTVAGARNYNSLLNFDSVLFRVV